jgi:hypothetical protein
MTRSVSALLLSVNFPDIDLRPRDASVSAADESDTTVSVAGGVGCMQKTESDPLSNNTRDPSHEDPAREGRRTCS